jgi:hypothetical protein
VPPHIIEAIKFIMLVSFYYTIKHGKHLLRIRQKKTSEKLFTSQKKKKNYNEKSMKAKYKK